MCYVENERVVYVFLKVNLYSEQIQMSSCIVVGRRTNQIRNKTGRICEKYSGD